MTSEPVYQSPAADGRSSAYRAPPSQSPQPEVHSRRGTGGIADLLRTRGVLQLLGSEAVFDIGTLSHTAAMSWVAYQLTESTLWVGVVAGTRAVPLVLLPIFAGAIADRFDRRRLVAGVRLFNAVVIAIQAVMIGTQVMEPWHQLLFALVSGAAVALSAPAIWAFLADLVRPSLVPRANGMLTFVTNSGEMLGPVIAGITIASWGPEWVFATIAATYALGAYLVVRIPAPRRYLERLKSEPTDTYWHSLRQGLVFTMRKKPIPWLFAMVLSTNIFGVAAFPLIPDYAHEVFAQSGIAYGLLYGAFGMGMLTGSVLISLGLLPSWKAAVLFGASLIWDVAMVAFGFSSALLLSMLLLYAMGVSGMYWLNTALVLFQRAAPGAMRGRVMSLYTLAMGTFPLGWLYGAALASWVGNETALIISALGGTPLVVLALISSRELRGTEPRAGLRQLRPSGA